ncbi:MAG: hypothetical protein U0667_01875 [Chloroflexota bacterium]
MFESIDPYRTPFEWLFHDVYVPAQDIDTTLQFLEWSLRAMAREEPPVLRSMGESQVATVLRSILWPADITQQGNTFDRLASLMTSDDQDAVEVRVLVFETRAAIAWQSLVRRLPAESLARTVDWCSRRARANGYPRPHIPPRAHRGSYVDGLLRVWMTFGQVDSDGDIP